jgi:hypothetical protein
VADVQSAEPGIEKIVEVRPTVFIGLGGTGMEILLRLRRRILQADWKGNRLNSIAEFPVAGFLYFDTDKREARESGRASATDPMAKAVAFSKGETLQHKVDVGFYQKNKDNYPTIREWLPTDDLSQIDTEKGAGQVRAISRLLFFDQFDTFKAMVSEKSATVLANVTNEDDLVRLGITKTAQDLRIVVVCSIAGGTGSGAFIDIGLALRSMTSPRPPESVELFMMLPSGYAGANRDRVYANGFAALAELEHTMRPDPQPPYVKEGWTSVEHVTAERPYHEAYLFDTQNLSGDSTKHVEDVYDMIADILFEDFGSSDFAGRKRSVAVNKQQHKATMFRPPLGDGNHHGPMAFAQGFSAVGQSIVATTGSLELEAAVSDASRTMLEAFFGVAESSGGRQPSVKDRDAFMKSKLFLNTALFDDFPEFLRPRPPAIVSYELVEQLLKSDDGKSIHGRLEQDLSVEFRAMREQASEPKDWARLAENIRARYESEVLSRAGTASIRLNELADIRNKLFRAITAEDGAASLKQALYNLVDDRENGGLDFTIALVQQIRAELAKDQTGIRAQLDQAAIQLRAVADDVMSRHLIGSLKKLERAAQPGMFGGVDRRAAEEYLKQIETDLGAGLKYWLRASAALEAITLLHDIANYLGEQSEPDEKGEVTWTGLLRELDEGRRSVRAVGDLVAAEARRVRDAINRPDHGVYIVIDRGAGHIAEERVRVEPREWANEKFEEFGGCRKLFPRLRNDQERLALINQLRAVAKQKLANEEAKIPSATAALCSLPPAERSKIVDRLLKRAMPWYPAQFDRFKPTTDRFAMIIAAPDAAENRDALRKLIEQNLPGLVEFPTIEESSSRGKIICYCELSGLPLDSIRPLRDSWRKSYEKQLEMRGALPLHNHWDFLRFPNPVVPSPAEIEQLRQKMTLFLKGVLYGVLRRGLRSEAGEDSRYYLDMSHSDFHTVGTERKIKARDFNANHRGRLAQLIEDFEKRLSALQWMAVSALARWTAYRAYTPIREIDEATEREQEYPGLGFQVALALAEEMKKRAKAGADAKTLPLPLADLQVRLQGEAEAFTIPIMHSVDDVEASEVNKAYGAAADYRATDKRRIDPDKFTDAHLTSLLEQPAPAAAAAVAPPPPPTALPVSYFVAADGDTTGPFGLAELGQMSRDGVLTPATLVYDANGGGAWVAARGEGALTPLFPAKPPPPPKKGPPPPPPPEDGG